MSKNEVLEESKRLTRAKKSLIKSVRKQSRLAYGYKCALFSIKEQLLIYCPDLGACYGRCGKADSNPCEYNTLWNIVIGQRKNRDL